MQKLFFLDKGLNFVDSLDAAVAVLMPDKQKRLLEVVFLKPIAHDLNIYNGILAIENWVADNYPQLFSDVWIHLPSLQVCQCINHELGPQYKRDNCITNTPVMQQGHVTGFWKICGSDTSVISSAEGIQENCYAAFYILLPVLRKHSPQCPLQDSIFD